MLIMVKFAVMTFMYKGWADSDSGSHETLLETLSESGAAGVEAFCNHFFADPGLLRRYQQKMRELDLAMPVMDLLVNLAEPYGVQREAEYEKMRKGIDICEAFGTEIVHLAGCKLSEGDTATAAQKRIVEGMMNFIDDIEKRGMTLAFEDFDPSPGLICAAEDCLEIIRLSNNRVKFVFDTGNFVAAKEKAEDNFDRMIQHCCHFHFKDFQAADNPRGYAGTHFGQGMIANRLIAQKIKAAGYQGWVALESYPQDGNDPRKTVPKELKTLKSYFA
jgi:sugar phosphate isomerase/epimerase